MSCGPVVGSQWPSQILAKGTKNAILLNKIKERSYGANIESLWNTKTWETPVQLAFLIANFLWREEPGDEQGA